jgi:hypothetical protein
MVRREMRAMLVGGTAVMALGVACLMGYCLMLDMKSVHLAVLAVLTTSGPLVARIFSGLVRRRQRLLRLDLDSLEAEDEVLIARSLPLAMPVIGTLFAYLVVL